MKNFTQFFLRLNLKLIKFLLITAAYLVKIRKFSTLFIFRLYIISKLSHAQRYSLKKKTKI